MKVRIGKKLYRVYAFDIESHNDEESIANNTTSMWLGCLIDETSQMDDPSSYTYTMEETIEKINILCHPKRKHTDGSHITKNLLIYVYNLAFEYSFLLPVLLEQGWKWKDVFEEGDEKVFNAVTTKTLSSVWQIKLKFDDKGGEVIFRDLAKMYAGGLGNIAKSFGLETQKGEIDYTLNRLHGHIVTQEEYKYIFKDCKIVVEIIQRLIENNDKLFFKNLSMSSYACETWVRETWKKELKPYKAFRTQYPFLIGEEADFLRKATSGGITYATPLYQFKNITDVVCHIDKYSMHPSSAYYNRFPYGYGTHGEGKCNLPRKMVCYHIKVSYTGVKLHSVICLIGIDFIEDFDLWIWDFEIETMKKCYENLKIEYIDYWAYDYKRLAWKNFFRDCFSNKELAEQKGDAFGRLRYKLLMNSSYGKLLEKPHLFTFQNIIGVDGLSDSLKIDKEVKDEKDKYNSKYTYLPVGSCIPAYSRCDLIETALTIGWNKVTYFDTDSIFFIWDKDTRKALEENITLVPMLGGWKIEEFLSESQFALPKRYKARTTEGKEYVKAGGFNFTRNDDIMQIDIISSEWEVKTNYKAKGGTLIVLKKKAMEVPKKYLQVYEKNVILDSEGRESRYLLPSLPSQGEDEGIR